MNAIGNMHGVKLPNIDILSKVIYYILPLTIIYCFRNNAVGFQRSDKFSLTYLQFIKVTTNEFFSFEFFIILDWKIYYMIEGMKRKIQKYWIVSRFNYV